MFNIFSIFILAFQNIKNTKREIHGHCFSFIQCGTMDSCGSGTVSGIQNDSGSTCERYRRLYCRLVD